MTVELVLSPAVVSDMVAKLARAGMREIGGILMARQIKPGHFEVVDFSVDDMTGERAHFVRDPSYHNDFLQAFFERTGRDYQTYNYIGEWHSHPGLTILPSLTDLESMESLVDGERDIPFAVLLIVRSDHPDEFLAVSTFHQRGAAPSPVQISFDSVRTGNV
ncbi:Mov34/MPN/PAD-1 family protein [Rhizobium bangladeshense]|uniref:Mov34/MPN/PAD-1 family protein n=1 Tax=Rhizobium bangladeshense TaxID=1138189 RepID=UPI001A99FCFD|nr:Mov34/MPN/PAD-1 family protein [Rhizobium bangladeshense]QSY96045.1 Mov34/MPN/PAD-1 family protein [Rhizobium bangladeshense]